MEPTRTPINSNMTAEEVKDKLGEFVDWGHINFESANGVIHSNARAFEFKTADEYNEWAKKHIGTFACQVFPLVDKIVVIANRKLDEETQAIMQDYADAIRKFTAEAQAKRTEAKMKEEEELKKRVDDLERLQELGRKCEHNHGAVIEENQKLKKELKAARKGK